MIDLGVGLNVVAPHGRHDALGYRVWQLEGGAVSKNLIPDGRRGGHAEGGKLPRHADECDVGPVGRKVMVSVASGPGTRMKPGYMPATVTNDRS